MNVKLHLSNGEVLEGYFIGTELSYLTGSKPEPAFSFELTNRQRITVFIAHVVYVEG